VYGKLLCIFRERFWDQLEFAQRAKEFGIRLFSGGANSVDRGVVAIWRPKEGFCDVVIFAVGFGPHDFSFFHKVRANGHSPLVL
jgi:hypothetical protein